MRTGRTRKLPQCSRPGPALRARARAPLAATCCAAFALGCPVYSDVEQPIAFEHKVHVAEEEIPCTDCHRGAEEADHATIPIGEYCIDCHEEPIGDGAEEIKLAEMLVNEEPIPWKRVHKLAEHVRFSHRRHVLAGKVLCETCHGEVPERVLPFARPFISYNTELGMERCIACHLESGNPRASVDCALCHR
jgi:hypothetical protein